MARKQGSMLQDLTYLVVGLKKFKKTADDFVKIGKDKEDSRLVVINTKVSAAYKIAISGIENIMKKEQKRQEKEKKKVNKYNWL